MAVLSRCQSDDVAGDRLHPHPPLFLSDSALRPEVGFAARGSLSDRTGRGEDGGAKYQEREQIRDAQEGGEISWPIWRVSYEQNWLTSRARREELSASSIALTGAVSASASEITRS